MRTSAFYCASSIFRWHVHMISGTQVFSNVRSAPVPVTTEELLTSQPLHEAIFRDAAASHPPVAMGALRFLGESSAYTTYLMTCAPQWPSG